MTSGTKPSGWAGVLLAGALLLSGGPAARGQAPSGDENSPPAAEAATPESPAAPAGGGSEREWSGPPQKSEAEKTFWEKVPPIQPYPRAGNFYIAPSGPGAYTLLDAIRGRELRDRPKNPYLQWGQNPNPLFNVDFRYLDDPKNTEPYLLAPLKRIHLDDDWLLSTGGEIRDRFATIENAALYNRRPQAGNDDRFNLFRTRVYGDLWYRDLFRFYAEFLTAESSPQSVPLASSDVARDDFLNLFVEAKVGTINKNGVYLRLGRQELLFGSQRLISPSDWSNTRRTFQGVRGSYHDDTIEEDVFVVNPVVPNRDRISSIDDKQVFAGNWFKYRFTKDVSVDLYYLYLDNSNPVARGTGGAVGGYDVNTVGARFVGDRNQVLWDFENAIQFGGWANQRTLAGMSVTGVGYWFKDLPATPSFWAYYDYASGDPNPGVGGTHRTFNTLFPFGHTYFAGTDVIGRQNIKDFHLELGMFPAGWVRLTSGFHVLSLDSAKDALYNPSGSVVRQDPTGRAGTDVGNAISETIQFHIDNNQVLLLNYVRLFSGPFIKATAVTPGAARDLDAFWVQYTFKW